MLPAMFAKRGSYGISGAAVIASGTGVAFLGLLGFEAIVEILNLLCEFSLCLGLFGFCPDSCRSVKPMGVYSSDESVVRSFLSGEGWC